MYVQGFSSSMPVDVQEEMYKSVKGFENLEIMRNAYAIEYDCINSLQLTPYLSAKHVQGLYFAGQINGTSGYEEAAAQGIIAGINASRYINNQEPFVLGRDEAYIGVLIDDLVTKGTNEPYRMMTSRAENRLLLRQDNADIRLTQKGRDIGLVSDERYAIFTKKLEDIEKAKKETEKLIPYKQANEFLLENGETGTTFSLTIKELIRRNNITAQKVAEKFGVFADIPKQVIEYINTEIKYEGYLVRQKRVIEQARKNEEIMLPQNFDYSSLKGLRIEAVQKLNKHQPINLGQASRISGVSPADIAVLTVYIKANKIKN